MSERLVNTNYNTLPDPRVIAWFEANGIDPNKTPACQEVLVSDDHIAYVEFISGDDGKKILGGDGYLKKIKVTHLISAPENHGL